MSPVQKRVLNNIVLAAVAYWVVVGLYYLIAPHISASTLAEDKERFLEKGPALLHDYMLKRDFPQWPAPESYKSIPRIKDDLPSMQGVAVWASIMPLQPNDNPKSLTNGVRDQLKKLGSAFDVLRDCAEFEFGTSFENDHDPRPRYFGSYKAVVACGNGKGRLLLDGGNVLNDFKAFDAAFQQVQYRNFYWFDLPQNQDSIAPTRYVNQGGFHDNRLRHQ